MTFWKTASHEEKAAQIIAGRELRMTWKQIGMNCGTSADTIEKHVERHELAKHYDYQIYGDSISKRLANKGRDRTYWDYPCCVKDLTEIFK